MKHSAIKFCGLTRIDEIAEANRLQVDYVGFVFAENSKRAVTLQQAQVLSAHVDTHIQRVGVFVNDSIERIGRLVDEKVIDVVQLHGCESNDYIGVLRSRIQCPIIQAFVVDCARSLERADCSIADYVLLDGGWGTGRVFDWTLLGEFKREFFLAGGLNPGNVSQALKLCRPAAVDVSSGIESDLRKDPIKMAAFVAAVRGQGEL